MKTCEEHQHASARDCIDVIPTVREHSTDPRHPAAALYYGVLLALSPTPTASCCHVAALSLHN